MINKSLKIIKVLTPKYFFIKTKISLTQSNNNQNTTQKFIISNQSIKQINYDGNSIQTTQQKHFAYGYYFPKDWDQHFIQNLLDPRNQKILQIQRMKNKIGQYNGKILFQFKTKIDMENIILKYNQDYITSKNQAHRIVIKPFQLKTQLMKNQRKQYALKNHVKVKNLNFQTTENQMRKLASSYGQILKIQMIIRPNGLNRGDCSIYFKKRKQAENFVQFIHGLQYEDRKLSADIIEKTELNWKKEIEKQFLQMPKTVFNANRQLAIRQSAHKKDYIDSL